MSDCIRVSFISEQTDAEANDGAKSRPKERVVSLTVVAVDIATLEITSVKSRLVALATAAVLIVSTITVSATEATYVLRGSQRTAGASTSAVATVVATQNDAAAARKIRVVLGSPYGN